MTYRIDPAQLDAHLKAGARLRSQAFTQSLAGIGRGLHRMARAVVAFIA